MFTHQLPKDDVPFGIDYSKFAQRHYLKRFEKANPGRQWDITNEGIQEDLSRISYTDQDLQQTQQVDELWQKDDCWIFKYDFRVAGRNESTKNSGNRCIVFLDNSKKTIQILIIYGKGDLPKNMSETQYITKTLTENYPELLEKCK